MSEKRSAAPTVSVIVPTRNEAGNIEPLLARLHAATRHLSLELLFVDDSTDETPQVITAVSQSARFPFPIRLIHRPLPQRDGLSGAVVAGFCAARGEWMAVMDADLQHPPEMIARMMAHAQATGADLVVGSRAADVKGPKGLSLARTLTSQSLTILARTVFPRLLKNASDPLTGLFLVRRTAVAIDQLRPSGFKILLELLVRCPDLHVSELFFDFAPRHAGSSKADFREGMRFFRHLLRLRATANVHFNRFVVAGLLALLLNNGLLLALKEWAQAPPLAAAVLALEATLLFLFAGMEGWVFERRGWAGRGRRLFDFMLLNHLFLLVIWLPLIVWASGYGRFSLLAANLLALLAATLARYVVSEQWIWTRGLIAAHHEPFRYDIHGIVGIESPLHLPDLAAFRTVAPLPQVDIRLKLDRHGTPTCAPGAICYDEKLGRFGFGLAIMPGDVTEAVVSPLLGKSPYVLYKNVVEPLLRWTLVRKGYALVYGGCVAVNGRAVLITADMRVRKTAMLLAAIAHNDCDFMSDEITIVGENGRCYSFPKLLAVRQHAIRAVDTAKLNWSERLRLRLKRLIYDEGVRTLGLALARLPLPIATMNAYLQRFVPPAKYAIHRLLPQARTVAQAQLAQVVRLAHGPDAAETLSHAAMRDLLLADGQAAYGFPPYTLLVERLSHWRGEELAAVEQAIITNALTGTAVRRWSIDDFRLTIDDWITNESPIANLQS